MHRQLTSSGSSCKPRLFVGGIHPVRISFAVIARLILSSGGRQGSSASVRRSQGSESLPDSSGVHPSAGGCGRFPHRFTHREGRERKPLPPVAVSAALLICVSFYQRLSADLFRMVDGFGSFAKNKPACKAGFLQMCQIRLALFNQPLLVQ